MNITITEFKETTMVVCYIVGIIIVLLGAWLSITNSDRGLFIIVIGVIIELSGAFILVHLLHERNVK